jgi:hypothetical protein
MNAYNGRISKRLRVMMPLAASLMVTVAQAAEDKPTVPANPSGRSAADTAPAGSARSDRQTVLLVRASAVPLGDNSVTSVSSQEAQQELKAIESGLFRRSLVEPKVLSVPEQGGWVRGFFKEPKASKLWSFFNPKAPLDSETDLMRSARIFGIRGDAPLPTSMQDPIRIEPVGIRFWQMSK